jgi:Carboxypeptidase regulatory-like domain
MEGLMRSGLRATFTACGLGLVLILFAKPSEMKPMIIRGLVTDEADAPIPDAVIELNCRQGAKQIAVASAKSREDGHFQIRERLRGVCKVNISVPGFSDVLIQISESDRRAIVDLGNIRLRLNCKGPGVYCDEVTPVKPEKPNDK